MWLHHACFGRSENIDFLRADLFRNIDWAPCVAGWDTQHKSMLQCMFLPEWPLQQGCPESIKVSVGAGTGTGHVHRHPGTPRVSCVATPRVSHSTVSRLCVCKTRAESERATSFNQLTSHPLNHSSKSQQIQHLADCPHAAQ